MEPFKPWSKGYSTGMANSDAVLTAEGIPVCRMVEPVVPHAIEVILAAPAMHKALTSLIQCILKGDDPTDKYENGMSLVKMAQLSLPR